MTGIATRALVAILAALIISGLSGCASASGQINELMAYVPGIEPTPSATSAPTKTTVPSASPTDTASPTPAPQWSICTGVERGSLNVRGCAGTSCPAVAVLREGRVVARSGLTQELSSGLWVMITDPANGWVNAKFLCESKE